MITTTDILFKYPNGPSFTFPDILLKKEENLLITGSSGIGKTTLLHILGLLITPDSGKITVSNQNLNLLSRSKQDNFRGKHIGFIFQKPQFIKSLNVLQQLKAKIYFSNSQNANSSIEALLKDLGILELKNKKISELSEGQKQRLSIAVALVNKPKLILADEPTSSLDDENCKKVIELLKNTAKSIGANLIVITHDQRIKPHFKNTIQL